jgi:hypothetical protein
VNAKASTAPGMSGVNPGNRHDVRHLPDGAGLASRWHRVNEDVIQAALAALHRDRAALRDAAPALRDLTASIDAQAD